jgi:hypothetical protein
MTLEIDDTVQSICMLFNGILPWLDLKLRRMRQFAYSPTQTSGETTGYRGRV